MATVEEVSGPTTAQGVDRRYFQEATTWERDVSRAYRAMHRIAWVVAAFAAVLSLVLLGILAMLLPLKTYEPYMIVVDKTTGFVEVKRPMAAGSITQDEAIAMFNVVRYIKARETYDASAVKDNFDLTQLMATGTAASDLITLYSPGNPESPVQLFGSDTAVSVFIKSVTFSNPHTALVRFSTEEKSASGSTPHDWVSLVRFKYTTGPMRNDWRFDNPLGFQVYEYRRDQESILTPTSSVKP